MAELPHQNPQAPHQDHHVPQGPLQNPHVPQVPPEIPNQDQQIPVPKKNKGRQRVDVSQKMQNEGNRQVTFSKRRYGLFKKASELVTLCGVELMMIVFSPTGKPYSYGHPSVDNIIDRFLTGIPAPPDPADDIVVAQRNEHLRLLNMQLTNAHAILEAEGQRELEIENTLAVSRTQHRWEAPLEEQSRDELLHLRAALEALQVTTANEAERRMLEQQQNPSAFQPGSSGARGAFTLYYHFVFHYFPINMPTLCVLERLVPWEELVTFFPPFPPSPNPFGEFGSGFSQFLEGSSSSGGIDGGPASSAGVGALPVATWPGSVAASSGFSGGLPPFPGDASSFGRGGVVTFPPGPSSFERGDALQLPPGPSSFERGDGSDSGDGGPMPPSSSGHRGGRGFNVRGARFWGFGRGAHVRGFGRGRSRGRPSGSGHGHGRS
ncbi:hypothetical protein Vadar_002665 [Vaccinium darrowii]|uniref:Uncharacterized protein n=1 Tax=Vaccinium darrowii TaxID=229202 RepID=A0ACB7WX47_9ERIC|nr:hypothetical protein Vadar_002665 [Vaccinium darrowii]